MKMILRPEPKPNQKNSTFLFHFQSTKKTTFKKKHQWLAPFGDPQSSTYKPFCCAKRHRCPSGSSGSSNCCSACFAATRTESLRAPAERGWLRRRNEGCWWIFGEALGTFYLFLVFCCSWEALCSFGTFLGCFGFVMGLSWMTYLGC